MDYDGGVCECGKDPCPVERRAVDVTGQCWASRTAMNNWADWSTIYIACGKPAAENSLGLCQAHYDEMVLGQFLMVGGLGSGNLGSQDPNWHG